jgi:hypothetical protein
MRRTAREQADFLSAACSRARFFAAFVYFCNAMIASAMRQRMRSHASGDHILETSSIPVALASMALVV